MGVQVVTFDQLPHATDPFYSPDSSFNDSLAFSIRPFESVIITICNTSPNSHQSEHKRIRFIKGCMYTMTPGLQLCFVVKNVSNETILCKTGTRLSTLLSNSRLQHKLCHVSERDIHKTQTQWNRGFSIGINKNLISTNV